MGKIAEREKDENGTVLIFLTLKKVSECREKQKEDSRQNAQICRSESNYGKRYKNTFHKLST